MMRKQYSLSSRLVLSQFMSRFISQVVLVIWWYSVGRLAVATCFILCASLSIRPANISTCSFVLLCHLTAYVLQYSHIDTRQLFLCVRACVCE
jgi:hypothetical protein